MALTFARQLSAGCAAGAIVLSMAAMGSNMFESNCDVSELVESDRLRPASFPGPAGDASSARSSPAPSAPSPHLDIARLRSEALTGRMQKVPLLTATVDSIVPGGPEGATPTLLLSDRSGSIQAAVEKAAYEQVGPSLQPGNTLVLRNAAVLRIQRNLYLNITAANIISVNLPQVQSIVDEALSGLDADSFFEDDDLV